MDHQPMLAFDYSPPREHSEAAHDDNTLRSSPTFHAVKRSENFRGFGMVPRLTMRQMVAEEQPNRA
jgi:hypothetical protein